MSSFLLAGQKVQVCACCQEGAAQRMSLFPLGQVGRSVEAERKKTLQGCGRSSNPATPMPLAPPPPPPDVMGKEGVGTGLGLGHFISLRKWERDPEWGEERILFTSRMCLHASGVLVVEVSLIRKLEAGLAVDLMTRC